MATLESLRNLLSNNVCEIVFVRRRPRSNRQTVRRMICTLDDKILNSTNGRLSLNYMPPSRGLPYDAASKNLLPVWDIFMQDWRMVGMENCQIINTIAEEEFWKYFNDTLMQMTTSQKMAFMDS